MNVQTAESEPPQVSVLVVGDWLVDEYWVVGKHRSSTSTRTGLHHTRALHTSESSVRSLCGAGQVATILHQAEHHGKRVFDLSGIGVWHPDDTEALAEMLEPDRIVGKTPHRLTEVRSVAAPPTQCMLHSFAADSGVSVGTTRVIRIYESVAEQLEIVHRLDWELALTTEHYKKMRRSVSSAIPVLFENRRIEHILVKDLLKGAVDGVLIKALRKRFPDAHWYISSKEWDPKWLSDVPRSHVKLIFIPPKAAQRARAHGAISSSWLTEGGPSKEALDAVKDLNRRFPEASVIVLPDEHRIMAYQPGPTADKARVVVNSHDPAKEPTTAMASIFFATVVAYLATLSVRPRPQSPNPSATDLDPVLQESLTFTRKWQTAERLRLTNYSWKPLDNQTLSLHEPRQHSNWRPVNWKDSHDQWEAAFTDLGLVTEHRREEFQLWRGMTELSDYVACTPTKRQALYTIIRAGQALHSTRSDERRQKSYLIVDKPGSGKSYMLGCLKQKLGFTLMHFNITRIESKNEIFKFLEDVSRTQRSLRDPLLIFIDEIDAKIGQREAYEAFLEPLEDGKFGGFGQLEPALWIFAGTKKPSRRAGSNKAGDFLSRLSHSVFDFRNRAKNEFAKVEQVYVGVACLLKRFPEITQVSRRVLRAFRLLKEATPREIRRFVSEFEEVQIGRVMVHNIPRDEWERRFELPPREIYRADDEHELVPIRVHPVP